MLSDPKFQDMPNWRYKYVELQLAVRRLGRVIEGGDPMRVADEWLKVKRMLTLRKAGDK